MSAFGGKADILFALRVSALSSRRRPTDAKRGLVYSSARPLQRPDMGRFGQPAHGEADVRAMRRRLMSALKRTSLPHRKMSANDPKRTSSDNRNPL